MSLSPQEFVNRPVACEPRTGDAPLRQLEKVIARVGPVPSRKDWRNVVGKFRDSEFMCEVDKECLRMREAEWEGVPFSNPCIFVFSGDCTEITENPVESDRLSI